MGWFEEYPWLLVPLIIVTVEFWTVLKDLIKRAITNRQEQ
jgi:hypothetical protein